MSKPLHALIVLITVLAADLALAAGKTELTWYGHSAFKLVTPSGKVLLLDPWITNPANKHGKEDLAAITRADLILITHGHPDHVGDAVEIARRTGAKLVSTNDLGRVITRYGGYPPELAGADTQGNFGGELTLLNGEVRVAIIPAVHSSTLTVAGPGGEKDIHMAGNPAGFLISVRDGPTLYDTGDTDVFSDMTLIPRFHAVDVMLACIGDHNTMGPARAADAVDLVRPRTVIPMHFGTVPTLTGTVDAFAAALKQRGSAAALRPMSIGETLSF